MAAEEYFMDLTVRESVCRFLDHRRRKRRAPATIELYERQLGAWRTWRDARDYGPALRGVAIEELKAFFAGLDDAGYEPATIQGHYRTLRALWNYLRYEEDAAGECVLSATQLRFFHNGRIPLPPIPVREQPALPEDDYSRLLAEAARNPDAEEAARDEAILRLLWETGMRVHEIAGLTHEQADLRQRRAVIVGKGDKQATVFWGPLAASALTRYLAARRGRAWRGALLRGASSRNDGGPVTTNLIRALIKRLAARAGVELPKGSPCHSFRRAFARRARAKGASLAEVGELLRDETPTVIRAYIGLDAGPRQQLYNRLFGA
jgi:integrase/recombinase XerD